MLSTDKQTNRQTNQRYQKHNLLCQGGNQYHSDDVNMGLQHQTLQCFSESNSIRNAIIWHLSWWKCSVSCLLFHELNNKHLEETELLCRVINSRLQIKPRTWLIAVLNQCSLYKDFLHFQFHLRSLSHFKW